MTKYGIGIAYGLGTKDGKPQIHAVNKLRKLSELIFSGEVQRGIVTGKEQVDTIVEYLVRKMRVPREKIYTDEGTSFVTHMYHTRERVRRWIRDGEIPSDVVIHHIVQYWAAERAELDTKWILPYSYKIDGVKDGRSREEIWRVDLSDEPRRMKVDQLASKIPILSKHYPPGAQYFVYFRYPPNPSRILEHLERISPIHL